MGLVIGRGLFFKVFPHLKILCNLLSKIDIPGSKFEKYCLQQLRPNKYLLWFKSYAHGFYGCVQLFSYIFMYFLLFAFILNTLFSPVT